MMPFYGGFFGAGVGYGALRQGQQIPGAGMGNSYANGMPPAPYANGGYGNIANQQSQMPWSSMHPPTAASGGSYGFNSSAPQQAQPQQPAQPNYTGLPGATNANYSQDYSQFLGQMYQPPQQINQSSQPIANRPMTYRPIQQQLPSFGSYSRY